MWINKETVASAVVLCAGLCTASPVTRALPQDIQNAAVYKRSGSFGLLSDMFLLDARAYRPSSSLIADFETYTFVRYTDDTPTTLVLEALEALGVSVGSGISNAVSRLSYFFAIPESISFSLKISQSDCTAVTLGPTARDGFLSQEASIGACSSDTSIKTATVKTGLFDNRKISANIYPAGGRSGFGIIADIDDTIKNSYVLDLMKAAQAAFIDDFTPVTGMPELFTYLNTNLNAPSITYVSGNFIQFYPFLQPFIAQYYIPGPISLRNFSFTNIEGIIDFTNLDDLQAFKEAEVTKLIEHYPQKLFVNFGDSTQRDPEVYGEIYRQYGDAHTQCIFIREVDLANNTAARFEAAFEGVPASKWKVFTDPSELMSLDVASGQCN